MNRSTTMIEVKPSLLSIRRWSLVAEWRLLAWPVALYLVLGVGYLAVIPLGESPDEPGHIICLEQVSLLGRLPLIDPLPEGAEWFSRGRLISGRMCYHMPFYYVVGGLVQATANSLLVRSPGATVFPETTDFPFSPTLFVRPVRTSFWERFVPFSLTAVRIFTMGVGLLFIGVTFDLVLKLTGDRLIAGLAAVLVAGWPQFLFMSRAISNDLLASFFALLVLYFLLSSDRPERFLISAVVASLAVLTKVSLYFTFGIIGFVLAVDLLVRKTLAWKEGLRWGALAAGIMTMSAGLIFFVPPMSDHLGASQFWLMAVNPEAGTLVYWQRVGELTLSSLWARFGWMSLAAPNWQNWVWSGFLLLTGVPGLVFFSRRLQTENRAKFWTLLIWCLANLFIYFQINVVVIQPQFRFLLPLIPLIAGFAAAGSIAALRRLQLPSPVVKFTPYLSGLILVAANLWLIKFVLMPVF